MKSNGKKKQNHARRTWLVVLILLLAAAGGGFGYYTWSQQKAATAQAATSTVKTTQVKQGSITISVTGSGTLTSGQEKSLSFSTSGSVAKVAVQVGDTVKQGQVLAQLSDLTALQDAIGSAQQDLTSAQQDLAALKQNADANLANAKLTLISVQKAVTDAKSSVVEKDWQRCDQKTMDAYYYKVTQAQAALDALGDGGGNQNYYLTKIVPAKNALAQANAAYEYCAGYTDYEVTSSQATLSLDQAKLVLAQQTLDTLTENNGVDPIELAAAENKVTGAQLALDQAKATLAGATLKAPFDGTILTVAGEVGDSVGTSAFITIADLAHPQMQFSIDETDMEKLFIGEPATITFDAIPDQTFTGKVTRINPALSSSGGYQVVTGVLQIDLSQADQSISLLKGLNGTVELIQSKTEANALIVPLQALKDLGDGSYAVFVVGADGQPRLKVVEVGLQDAASAEIKSGVKLGDVVTTGTVQTK